MYSAYNLNKQGNKIQPWHTPFTIWNQSVVPCLVLTVPSWLASCLAYRFLRRQVGKVVWYSHLFQNFQQFVVIHTVKGFGVVNEAKIDVFLELSCFFDDPMDVGNLISDSSAFSKSNLNIWMFLVHVLLKPHLENFEHYFASVWDECNYVVVWTFVGIAFLWEENGYKYMCGWVPSLSPETITTLFVNLLFPNGASLVAQKVKNLPAMRDTQVQSLGQEDTLEKGMATHSSILSCLENSTDRGAWRATVHGVAESQIPMSD